MGSFLNNHKSILVTGLSSALLFSTLAFGEEYHFTLTNSSTGAPTSLEGLSLENALQKLQWAQSVLAGVEGSSMDQDKISEMIKSIETIQRIEGKIQKQVDKDKAIAPEKDAENQAALVDAVLSISQNVDWYVENGRDPQGIKAEIKKVVGLSFVVKMAGFILGQYVALDSSPETLQTIDAGDARLIAMLGFQNRIETRDDGTQDEVSQKSIYTQSREASDALNGYAKAIIKNSVNRASAIRILVDWFEEDVFYLVTNNIFSSQSEGVEMRLRALDELVYFAEKRGEQFPNKVRRFLTDFIGVEEKETQVFTNVVYHLTSSPVLKNEYTLQNLQQKKVWYNASAVSASKPDEKELRDALYERDRIIGEALRERPVKVDANHL